MNESLYNLYKIIPMINTSTNNMKQNIQDRIKDMIIVLKKWKELAVYHVCGWLLCAYILSKYLLVVIGILCIIWCIIRIICDIYMFK